MDLAPGNSRLPFSGFPETPTGTTDKPMTGAAAAWAPRCPHRGHQDWPHRLRPGDTAAQTPTMFAFPTRPQQPFIILVKV